MTTLPLAAGFVLVAGSAAALLAVGPRVLSPGAFSGISIAWTISVIFGFGIATPTEQVISRRRNAGDVTPGRGPAFWLGTVGLVGCAAVVVLLRTEVGHRYPTVSWSLVALIGWVLVSPQRGELLGHQAVRPYAGTMMLEGLVRIAMVLLAAVWGSAAEILIGASIGLPLLLSAGAARLLSLPGKLPPEQPRHAPGFEQIAFIITALGYQASINLPPLALSWKVASSNRDFVGAFVVANSWMRLPTVLVGSVTVAALAELSRVSSTGSLPGFVTELRRSGLWILVLAVGGSVVCGVTAEPATTLLFGSHVDLPAHGYAYLGLSTALAIVATWLSVPLMATRHASTSAVIWASATALTMVTVGVLSVHDMLTFGLILPLVVTTAALFTAATVRVRAWSRAIHPTVGHARG
jgi:O-antigen/teichoic acid export membrane protein